MKRILFFAACLLACGAAGAQEAQPELKFHAERHGDFVTVAASVELPVEPAVAWSVLTDYEGYPRFISNMRESRVLARNGAGLVVEQKGEIGLLFFTQSVEARMLVVETPTRGIFARAIDGSFRDLTGRYEVQPAAAGVRLDYSGRFVPDFFLPPFIGMIVVRYALERHFSELIAEIMRRGARAQPTN